MIALRNLVALLGGHISMVTGVAKIFDSLNSSGSQRADIY